MGFGTQPHDWKLDEFESMKNSPPHCLSACPSLLYVTQPIAADQHERHAVLRLAHAAPYATGTDAGTFNSGDALVEHRDAE
jgi:hypothetical protein